MGERATQHRPVASPEELTAARPGIARRDGHRAAAPTGLAAGARPPHAAALERLAGAIDRGPRVAALRSAGELINGGRHVAQLRAWGAAGGGSGPTLLPPSRPAGGLPAQLRAGVEALSGLSLDRVKVHYNSAEPAQLSALAYARGTEIHLGPGQEAHLPHEAWHVVQQARGQVKPTVQLMDGVAVNDDSGLEREAEAMGRRAARVGGTVGGAVAPAGSPPGLDGADAVVQAVGNRSFDELLVRSAKLAEDLPEQPSRSAEFAARSLAAHAEASDFDEEVDEDLAFDEHRATTIEEDRPDSDSVHGASDMDDEIRLEPHRDDEEEQEEEWIETGSGGEQDYWGGVRWDEREDAFDRESSEDEEEEARPVAAYIVNAILPFGEVDRIPEVVEAMLRGLGEGHAGRVAVVLGINAPDDKDAQLTAALERAEQLVKNIPVPIGLVRSSFRAGRPFPYGTMRNQVMHSPETRGLTTYFTRIGLHPYLSFQDFDTGSRSVGSELGPHVFEAVDEILSGRAASGVDRDMRDPVRPLMIAGGYRTGGLRELVDAVMQRLQKEPIEGMTREIVEKELAKFPGLIAQDMKARDQFAELDPLLPYAPEPNLFIDATAAAIPSPLTRTRLEFGEGGAEFTALGKSLAQYAAEELESFHSNRLPEKDADPELLEDVQADLSVDAQTNRHPQRGKSFHTDFQDLSVATDLSRLAHGFLKGEAPQSHVGLTQVANRFFDTKKAKSGSSLSGIQSDFEGRKDKTEFMSDLYVRQEGVQSSESAKYFNKNKTKLGGLKRQQMSGALQQPLSRTGLFKGLSFGTEPDRAMYFAHQVALMSELKLQKERAMRQSVQDEAQRIGVSEHYRIGHADGGDRNCTIISIFAAAGVEIDRQEALVYRRRLADAFPIGLDDDITLTRPIAQHILGFVQQRTGRSRELYVLGEGPPDDDDQPTYEAASLAGEGLPIFIFFAGTHFSPAWPI